MHLKRLKALYMLNWGEGGGGGGGGEEAQRERILVIVMHVLVHMHNEKLVCIPSCVHLLTHRALNSNMYDIDLYAKVSK